MRALTALLAGGLRAAGAKVNAEPVFDTLTVGNVSAARVHANAAARRFNLRPIDAYTVGIALDETTSLEEVQTLLACFSESVRLPELSDGAFDAAYPRRSPARPPTSRRRLQPLPHRA